MIEEAMSKLLLLFPLLLVLASIPGDVLGQEISDAVFIYSLVVWLWTSPGVLWFLLKLVVIPLWLGGVVLIFWAGAKHYLAPEPITMHKRFFPRDK
jgi:hypothetical protein